jgi:predicted lactoylglutathione lyase
MIGYVTLGTNDLARAGQFYDVLLAELGARRLISTERFINWTVGPDTPVLCVMKPFDKSPATAGNGVMIALTAESKEQVDALHELAIGLGAQDEGAPGMRGPLYVAYFRDMDGHKLNVFYLKGA